MKPVQVSEKTLLISIQILTMLGASPVSDNEPIPSHSTFRAATITGRPVVRNLSNRLKDHYREEPKPVHNPMYDK